MPRLDVWLQNGQLLTRELPSRASRTINIPDIPARDIPGFNLVLSHFRFRLLARVPEVLSINVTNSHGFEHKSHIQAARDRGVRGAERVINGCKTVNNVRNCSQTQGFPYVFLLA